MSNPYRALFDAPGATGFALAGLVARMPISMVGIGIITMLSQLRGNYGMAGAVAGTFALATAVLAPQVSRAVDRHGQGRVLPIAAAVSAAALLALLLCTRLAAPDWTLFVFAALAGCLPSMPAMARARWTEIYRGKPQLQTAYALESVLDEVCFIVGPPLAVGLSVVLFPEAGPMAAGVLLVAGVATFVAQRKTEPAVQTQAAAVGGSLIRLGAMRTLVLLLTAMGVIVGTMDVVSVAFATQQGRPAAASIVLSVYALGSCLAGLVFGTLKLNMLLPHLLRFCGIATAVTTLPLLLASTILGLSSAAFVAGLFFAPTMIVAMALVESSVPSARLTEGFTWLITGLGLGVALGAVLSGWVVDAQGPRAGFAVALGAGGVVMGATLHGYKRLLRN